MRLLKKISILACLLVVPVAFGQTPDWRFAHPGATLVGGFRVQAMLQSPLVNTLLEQATAKDPSTGAIVGMIRTGLAGVSEIRLSVRDMGKGKNPDVLALVSGQLDEAAMGALAQGNARARRIDASTLLIGEGPSLEDAVLRMTRPATGLQARPLERAKTLANYDFWIAGTLPALPMTVPVLDAIRGIAFGMSAQSDLRIEVALETASAEMAERLVHEARDAQKQQPALGAALLTEVDGSTARFRFAMEGSQVIQAVQQAMAGGVPSSVSSLVPPSPVVAPAEPPKPSRGTIIIYGLEDGPREIKTSGKP